jgi:hypothetical protein
MIARIAGTVILSLIVFVVVSLLVALGVWWWTGGLLSGAVIGVVCGFSAAFIIATVSTVVRRSGEHPRGQPSDKNERSSGGQDH